MSAGRDVLQSFVVGNHFYITEEQSRNTPSREDGISEGVERRLREGFAKVFADKQVEDRDGAVETAVEVVSSNAGYADWLAAEVKSAEEKLGAGNGGHDL